MGGTPPNGRLALVLPQSVLNSKEMSVVRRFLYRFFNLKCIVAMPRNIFIDTPTLTSLVFAQKKTAEEIAAWDAEWTAAYADSEVSVKAAAHCIRKANISVKSAVEIRGEFLAAVSPIASSDDWILKSGRSSAVLSFGKRWVDETGLEAADYYKEMLRSVGFEALRERYVLSKVAEKLNYDFLTFEASDVGYKLSKRKERAKPNDLMKIVGASGRPHTNLHLIDEAYAVQINETSPETILDHISKNVTWR